MSLFNTLSSALTFSKLAIHTGTLSALREEACSVQLLPKSFVMDTARLPPLLSRIFNIKTPGSISTTWASVVLVRAMLCIFHVLP